jgi:hypothetical protein
MQFLTAISSLYTGMAVRNCMQLWVQAAAAGRPKRRGPARGRPRGRPRPLVTVAVPGGRVAVEFIPDTPPKHRG